MKSYYINIILNHSILIPAVAGIIRSRSTLSSFYPFLLFIWLAAVNETVSLILILSVGSNTVTSNIYVLLEFLILLRQFYQWNEDRLRKLLFFAAIGIVVWIADNIVLHSIGDSNSVFRSYYSLIILLFSIDETNHIIMIEKKSLLKNAAFLICVAFIFYYGCKSFVEVINVFDLPYGPLFYRQLWQILSVLNCLSNIIFTFAIVWSPKQREFILLY